MSEGELGFFPLHCSDCRSWCGRCLAGKRFRLASSDACELYRARERVTE
jgi:hypothetical protein